MIVDNNVSFKTALPDSPHPIISIKKPGFRDSISSLNRHIISCFRLINTILLFMLAACCPKHFAIARKIALPDSVWLPLKEFIIYNGITINRSLLPLDSYANAITHTKDIGYGAVITAPKGPQIWSLPHPHFPKCSSAVQNVWLAMETRDGQTDRVTDREGRL